MAGSIHWDNLQVTKEVVGSGGWTVGHLSVAVKKLDPLTYSTNTPIIKKFMEKKIQGIRLLHHTNLVTVLDMIFSPHGEIYIVRELVPGSDLRKHLKDSSFTLIQRVNVAVQVAAAMCFLHKQNVLHHNLTPVNVILQNDDPASVKVTDVGFWNAATQIGASDEHENHRWTAPEPLLKKPYDERSDIFSFGLLLWCLFAREQEPPARSADDEWRLNVTEVKDKLPSDVPESLKDLILICCDSSPTKRLDFITIQKELQQAAQSLVEKEAKSKEKKSKDKTKGKDTEKPKNKGKNKEHKSPAKLGASKKSPRKGKEGKKEKSSNSEQKGEKNSETVAKKKTKAEKKNK